MQRRGRKMIKNRNEEAGQGSNRSGAYGQGWLSLSEERQEKGRNIILSLHSINILWLSVII